MKWLITILILLEVDFLIASLMQLGMFFITMFIQGKRKLNEWIMTVSGKQISILLGISEIIRIIICYVGANIVFAFFDLSTQWTWLVLGVTCLNMIIRNFVLWKYFRQMKAECQ